MACQSVYGMVDGAGNGGVTIAPAGITAYLYPDGNLTRPIAWETARIVVKMTAPYGLPAPGTLVFSVQKTHDRDQWFNVTIRNISEAYDGVTDNFMASDSIQVDAVEAVGATAEIAIGLREPAPFTRLVVTNTGATNVELEAWLYTTG